MPNTTRPTKRQPTAGAKAPPAPNSAGGLASRIRAVLDALTVQDMQDLRTHAPTIAGIVERLRSNRSLDLDGMRVLVVEAMDGVPMMELVALKHRIAPELALQIGDLVEKLLVGAKA